MHKRRIGVIATVILVAGMLVMGCNNEDKEAIKTTEVKIPGKVIVTVYDHSSIEEIITKGDILPVEDLTKYLKSIITVMYQQVNDNEAPYIDEGLIQVLELIRKCSEIYAGPTEDIMKYFEIKLENMSKISDPFYKRDLESKLLEWINNMDLYIKEDYPFILALNANDIVLDDKEMEIVYQEYTIKQYNAVMADKPATVKLNIENLKIAGETGIATQMYEQKRFESYFKDNEKHKDSVLKQLHRMGGKGDARKDTNISADSTVK